MAFVVTHTAAVTATLVWVIIEWLHRGKPTMFGAATGSIAGLATITPASGFVSPMAAIAIGAAAGAFCYLSLSLKPKLKFDDSLDAFGVHGVGGILGTIGAGLFAQKAINAAGADGLFFGNPRQVLVQLISIAIVAVFSFVTSLVLLKVIDGTIGLKVSAEEELMGLDLSQHEETGYQL